MSRADGAARGRGRSRSRTHASGQRGTVRNRRRDFAPPWRDADRHAYAACRLHASTNLGSNAYPDPDVKTDTTRAITHTLHPNRSSRVVNLKGKRFLRGLSLFPRWNLER